MLDEVGGEKLVQSAAVGELVSLQEAALLISEDADKLLVRGGRTLR